MAEQAQNSWSLAFDPGAGIGLAAWALSQASKIARQTPAGRAFTVGQALAQHLARRGIARGSLPEIASPSARAEQIPAGWMQTRQWCSGGGTNLVGAGYAGTNGVCTSNFFAPPTYPGGPGHPPPTPASTVVSEWKKAVGSNTNWNPHRQWNRTSGTLRFYIRREYDAPVTFNPMPPGYYEELPFYVPWSMPQVDPWTAPAPNSPPNPLPPEPVPFEFAPDALPQVSPQGDPLRGPTTSPAPYEPWPMPQYWPTPAPNVPGPHHHPGPGPTPPADPMPSDPDRQPIPGPVGQPHPQPTPIPVPDRAPFPDLEPVPPKTPWEREVDWRITYEPGTEPFADRLPHKNLPPVRGKEKEIKTYFRTQVPIVRALGELTETCDIIDSFFDALPPEVKAEYDSTEFLRIKKPNIGELIDKAIEGDWMHFKTYRDKAPRNFEGKKWHDARRKFNERNKNAHPLMRSKWGRKATCHVKAQAIFDHADKFANQDAMQKVMENWFLNEIQDRGIGKLGKGAAQHSNQTGQQLGWQSRGL